MLRVTNEMDRLERLHACFDSLAHTDAATAAHCTRVAQLADALCGELGIEGRLRSDVRSAALIHDIGKLAVPEAIIAKRGRLSPAEWQLVRQHPITGARLAARLELAPSFCDVVLYHHENWDGSGYPFALRGRQIPLSARVIRVVDVYDALTSERSYRSAYSTESALRIMAREAGSTLDPDVFSTFEQMVGPALERAC